MDPKIKENDHDDHHASTGNASLHFRQTMSRLKINENDHDDHHDDTGTTKTLQYYHIPRRSDFFSLLQILKLSAEVTGVEHT